MQAILTLLQKRMEAIAQEAVNSHVKGFIIPDLPYEEANVYEPIMQAHHLSMVSFVAPTDSKERIAQIVLRQKDLSILWRMRAYGAHASEDLSHTIARIKEHSKTPLFVGFGVNENGKRACTWC